MKRIVLFLIVLLLFSCTACAKYDMNSANISNAEIENTTSNIYSDKDMEKSLDVVLTDIKKIKGIYVYSVAYAGDEEPSDELKLRQEPPYNERISKCFCYYVSFKTSFWSDLEWGKFQKYNMEWIIAEDSSGKFYIIDSGIG